MILQSAMSPRTRRRSRPVPARPLTLAARARRRLLRLERGLTMKDVSRRAALTESFISQLERDRVNPSVASLQRLTAALGTPLGRLFDEAAPPEGRVVRRAQRARLTYPGLRATDYLLSPDLSGKLEMIWAEAEPGGGSGDQPYVHAGDEECVVVIKGRMEIWVGEERYVLHAGDAITFSSRVPHKWQNAGRGRREGVGGGTPP